MEAGSPTVIPNAEGARTTPSVVAYSKSGELLVGQIAKQFLQAVVNPENTFYSVKRFVGRQPGEVQEELKEVSYKVDFEGQKVKIDCPVMSKKFAPEEVSAQVLRKLSADAGKYLAATVQKVVRTNYWGGREELATKDAGKIAGLDVLRIVNEPTAASLAYGLEKKNNETILVFDLGGGTFDVSVLEVGDGVCEVLATNGDTHLGGDDFDKVIVDWLAEDFQKAEARRLAYCSRLFPCFGIVQIANYNQVFSTATDSQPSVEIVVLQGERQFAKDNKILGTFRLDGVPPAPRGVPQIEVTFDIDANGILNVGAKDRGTGKEQTITIAGSSTLDKTDVEKMVQDAEANAAEDEKRKEAVETKNNAESLVYQTEKQLQELGEKVPADLKASIDPKLQALKDKVGEAEPDTELLKTMTKDLQEELMKVGQAAYANTGASPPPGDAEAGGSPPPGDAKAEAKGKDDVIDVDGQ
eukprot:Skav229191  [mRNA]  locus=scaffold1004:393093:409006:- [translate_table: standard]